MMGKNGFIENIVLVKDNKKYLKHKWKNEPMNSWKMQYNLYCR